MVTIGIQNYTKRKLPLSSFKTIGAAVLPGWDLSVSFVGATRAKRLNQELRNKSYVPNVLSYEVGKKSGEIIICMDRVMKERHDYGIESPLHFAEYLFIHGLLHLKGYPHGPTMDKKERALMARFVPNSFSTNETPHRNRNRYRHTPDESRGGRRGARKR